MRDVSNNNHERGIGHGSLARGCRLARRLQTDFPSVTEVRSERRLHDIVCHTMMPSGFGVEPLPGNLAFVALDASVTATSSARCAASSVARTTAGM